MRPGTNCADAPVVRNGKPSWLLNELGDGFTVLVFRALPSQDLVRSGDVLVPVLAVGADLEDGQAWLERRYDGRPGTTYLIRPDHHVAARWRAFDPVQVEAAIARACGR